MAERHRRYLAWMRKLGAAPALASGLRDSRFCDAAALITGSRGLGAFARWRRTVGALVRLGILDRNALVHLEAISETLLACNTRRLEETVALRQDGVTDALAFDDAMVVFDQQAIEDYLRDHPLTSATRRGLDRLLRACASRLLGVLLGIDAALGAAVRQERRRGGVSFFSLATRVAIGQRLVRTLHCRALR